jgi:Tfp pilus assembly protein PilF
MTLRDDLMDIRGIGEAKTDEILAVLDDHDTDTVDRAAVQQAVAWLERGRHRLATEELQQALAESV